MRTRDTASKTEIMSGSRKLRVLTESMAQFSKLSSSLHTASQLEIPQASQTTMRVEALLNKLKFQSKSNQKALKRACRIHILQEKDTINTMRKTRTTLRLTIHSYPARRKWNCATGKRWADQKNVILSSTAC